MAKKDKGPTKQGKRQNDEERWYIYPQSEQQHEEDEEKNSRVDIERSFSTITPQQQTNLDDCEDKDGATVMVADLKL